MPAPIFIIRGAPSAGKSTFAERIRGKGNAFIFETDNFFMDLVNRHDYHFDPELLGMAHNWNQGEVARACRDCPDVPVIIANTFSQGWELKPYFEIAKKFKRQIFVYTLHTKHDHNAHGVPEKTIQKYRDGLQFFCMENWIKAGYPVVYSLDIMTDDEANTAADFIHTKFIEKH